VEVTRIVEVTRVVTETIIEEGEVVEVEVTRIVTEEIEVETGIEVTRVVTKIVEVEVVVTATAPPLAEVSVTPPPAITTPAGEPTETPAITVTEIREPTPTGTAIPPAATPVPEERVAELEWPPRMRLGDSDVVRLSVIPAEDGLIVTTEFPDHRTITGTVALAQPSGYDLVLSARLDGVGFDLSPEGDQRQDWMPGETMTWRWTISPNRAGQQRLSATLALQWLPQPGNPNSARRLTVFTRGLDVRVTTFLGLTSTQAILTGVLGLFLGVVLNLPLVRVLNSSRRTGQALTPNPDLVIEPHPTIELAPEEIQLLQAQFGQYARLTLDVEFHSGYSGARTFLAMPIRANERADAYTIVKIGNQKVIEKEYDNYKDFVEHTLPPITARVQDRPVTVAGRPRGVRREDRPAALRYTFVGEPGQKPVSLRQRFLVEEQPELLEKMFRTFGPNWWMQRRPYSYRLQQEYDRKLPSHYVLEPAQGRGKVLDGRAAPAELRLLTGDLVQLRHFEVAERKGRLRRMSLRGVAHPGQSPLRLRWLSLAKPEGATGRVVATRDTLLREWTADFERHGLPDPLEELPALLNETVRGSQSIIHGDLNLENILLGPGDMVWLIDFASTREGHALFDFAHLGAEIVSHIRATQYSSSAAYLKLLDSGGGPLLEALIGLASRCLFDDEQPREFYLAWYMSCLGALKHRNLDVTAKHLLYLTAAHLVRLLV
jgi:hypothetical protein